MTFTYSNAGHCYPLYLKNQGTDVDQLKIGGIVLGSFDFAEFEPEAIHCEPGGEILLYTDGVTETERESDGTFYSEEKLSEIFQSSRNLSAEMLCQAIETDLLNFSGTNHRNDDITIVVIKIKHGKE
jgi:sigma-B regulation protein RsbU (phosphoserine phosphatase)